jgi:hypothetical protein
MIVAVKELLFMSVKSIDILVVKTDVLLAVVARTCNLLIIRLTQEDLRSKLD